MFRHLFCVILISEVVSIPSPVFITREIGQDVVFMFNITNILTFNWGLRKGNTDELIQSFIRYDKGISDGITLDEKLNASSYAGRVSFVGDLTKGQAWFKITNLNINDTNQYMAKIYKAGYQYFPVKLTVVQPTTTIQPPSTSLTPTSHISQSLTTVPATVNPPTLINLTAHLKVEGTFSEKMKNITSHSFQDFAKRFGQAINGTYESITNFKSVSVISLRKGSIDVTFVIFFKSKIKLDEACLPLASAIKGGKLGDFQLVQGSLRCNQVISPTSTSSPTASPSTGVHPGIIAGVVIVGILAIVGLVIAIIFVFRKKASQKAYRNSTRAEPYAMERRQGEPEEQYASVQRPGALGEQVSDGQPLPQYAAVDKSKKMKNRDPNELVYATLDHDYNQSMGARPSSDRRTTGGSDTVYADIQKNRQQKQNQQQRHPPPQYGNLQPMDYA